MNDEFMSARRGHMTEIESFSIGVASSSTKRDRRRAHTTLSSSLYQSLFLKLKHPYVDWIPLLQIYCFRNYAMLNLSFGA